MIKELIIFDLDGTINVSKMPIDEEMARLLCELLAKTKIAIISGASFVQLEEQFLDNIGCSEDKLSKLFLLPTSGSSLYRYEQNKWVQMYRELFSEKEIEKIHHGFESAIASAGIASPEKIYGELIENRGSQVTYSALGQKAPIELKKKWDSNHNKREKIAEILTSLIPEFEVRIGGTTSIDVTKRGVDKAYGISKIEENLGILKKNMIFVGDSIFPGGNDYSVKMAEVDTIQVSGPKETKETIRKFIKNN